jgi:glutamate synthase (NADPH/NADH) large chain
MSAKRDGLYNPEFERDACGIAFIADVHGGKSHDLVSQSLIALKNLAHRGGSNEADGDGAGITIQIPHEFLVGETGNLGISLPEAGAYGVGMVFLPQEAAARRRCEQACENVVKQSMQTFLGWRDVPQVNAAIGSSAKLCEPKVRQFFVQKSPKLTEPDEFERTLYLIRRRIEKRAHKLRLDSPASFYIPSLSAKTMVYKGMLSGEQLPQYYPDLTHHSFTSAIAMVHQRFSTNTFPSWALAHPFRYVAHNGEINTLQGNKNAMNARQQQLQSPYFGRNFKDLLPIIQPGGSDSASLDNTLELLVMAGRSLPHAMMMLIPEPWSKHSLMNDERRAFYDFHWSLMEPWDGPALVGFTDGVSVGALLDRNGLRPARYCATKRGWVVMASEVGVIPLEPGDVIKKGRLEPGKMLLVDTAAGRILPDAELKNHLARQHPYREWLTHQRLHINDLPVAAGVPATRNLLTKQISFGYTTEELRDIILPMATTGLEPIGSMGTDTPIAVLSDHSESLFSYFRQRFAQVTNPPIDAIREGLVTSLSVLLGSEGNLLDPQPPSCRQLELPSPILTNEQIKRITTSRAHALESTTIPMLFIAADGRRGVEAGLKEIYRQADEAIARGCTILILSDRGSSKRLAPIPSLLATSALNHHLVAAGTRTIVSVIVSAGDAREVHHLCCLIGYGASAVNPYLALDSITGAIRAGRLSVNRATAIRNFIAACDKGILKVMSKMGISTVDGYRGAQIFEAIGLDSALVNKYFPPTTSSISGIGLATITREVLSRHTQAYEQTPSGTHNLDIGGEYKWRRGGKRHSYSPKTIGALQQATWTNDYTKFKEYSQMIDDTNTGAATIRGLLAFRTGASPIPIVEVEGIETIVKRFATGAMSYGSISQEAHETLAIAMNRIGGKSNTGEGGEDPARYTKDANGDSRNCAIKQVASGRFGVTSQYLAQATDIQIKMAQGAKPGEGGQLPGNKVYPWIAKVRHSTVGVGLISPPPHHDIYSIEDLAQLIYDLKNANPKARIGVKLVAEVGVGAIASGVAKARADTVLISGHDGGTGAAPLSSIKYAGIPWEIGLAETQQVLQRNGLRGRITVQVDGHLKTGRDIVVAALLGAEEFGFGTSALVTLGCVMMRACHLDTCPVGIATQNPELRKLFKGKPEHIQHFFYFLAQEVREYMAELGFRTMDDMIGRTDALDVRPAITHWKAGGLDLSPLLMASRPDGPARRVTTQDHNLAGTLGQQLVTLAKPALESRLPVHATLPIRNTDRAVGTMLGYRISKTFGADGLPDDTLQLALRGSAGQSFGAFIPRGLTLTLEGDANDHVGKGLSGGKIIARAPAVDDFVPEDNVIIGNVALYGATSGEAYINGRAGERFAVRNSGARTVVEGVGDHGCEYMTNGVVVVLGPIGRNFAAGMSGGMAFLLGNKEHLRQHCNMDMVELEPLTAADTQLVHNMILQHAAHTQSTIARRILAQWNSYLPRLIKVMPKEYKRALEQQSNAPEAVVK